jgi:hypothetical protein
MRILESEKITYLYINGIEVQRPIKIGNQVELLPAKCAYNQSVLNSFSGSDVSYGTALLFLPLVRGQLRISSDNPEELVTLAWNSQWDVVLLGALYGCDVSCNFHANTAAEDLQDNSRVEITNYHLRGLNSKPYQLTENDSQWLETNFITARGLLDVPEFQHAIHCLSTYRWHTYPGARLAIIWSGIEGLFKIENEVVFRLSLYISRFLEPADETKRKEKFAEVKTLYKQRSAAVHGSKIKGDPEEGVDASAKILYRLVYECININSIPRIDELAP